MIAKENRPFKFSEIEGQKANLTAFKNYSKTIGGTFPDVMLFQGNTGSGKTTCAYIIAATVNCENPVLNKDGYYEPCGECESCKSIKKGVWSKDTYFFNASEMKPDDVLDLEKYASTSPWHGGRKTVIIIDEFQELSNKSKGSSLVLFEKKRKDTIFILCTMDSKIEKAVQSRAQLFTFKSLTATQIENCLFTILDKIDPDEKLPFDPKALILIGENSWGSARQAIQTLERCIASELWTVDSIEKELSFLSEEKTYKILEKLVQSDSDFYKSIENIKTYDFYIYAWTVLSTINKTLLTEDTDNWKYKSSKKIVDNSNFNRLVDTFINIEKMGYFKDYIFDYYIGNYLQQSPKSDIVETPKRTRRVASLA